MIDLKPAKTVHLQPWMASREAKAVLGALGEEEALFVGGCVRNMLLGEAVEDIDIATQWTPPEVIEKLRTAGIKTVPTGIDHGTVTAVVGKQPFEVTTLRRDVQTDGRRAVVAFTKNWREDAQRRDFTMNTLLADGRGNIYDPTGEGLNDLENRIVRFVGDPETRIREDYLRILRFFRFYAFYGKGRPDAAGLTACRKYADQISTLSRERVTQEFFKILSVDNPVDIIELIIENNILLDFFDKEYKKDDLKYLCVFQNNYELRFIASRLFALAGYNMSSLKNVEKILLIPKVFIKDIHAISEVLNLPDLAQDSLVRKAVYKFGRTATAQALMIELAQDRVMNGYAPKALKIIQTWDVPDFPLSGEDLKQAGIPPGPQMGETLRRLEDWWIEQDFKPEKKAVMERI